MRVLFDHNVDQRLADHLPGHESVAARVMGWEGLANGRLIRAAAAGFDVLLTNDKRMEYEHNLLRLPTAIVVIDAPSIAMADIEPYVSEIADLLRTPLAPAMYVVNRDHTVIRLTAPRPKR